MMHSGSSGTVRKTILCKAMTRTVWAHLSKITALQWAHGVEKTSHLAGPKSGIGAGRDILFDGSLHVKEVITDWRPNEGLSYIAISGLCVAAYHATISVKRVGGKTRITWESVFADKSAEKVEQFGKDIGEFYSVSLRALRDEL